MNKLIGFKVLERTEAAASFTADGKSALLTIEQPARVIPKKQKTTGLYSFRGAPSGQGRFGSDCASFG